jgi:uncharacterized protein YqjF (DUF2071 family)
MVGTEIAKPERVRIEERARMSAPPKARPVQRQTWLDLVFLHYPLDPRVVQATLPRGLAVDTFPDHSGREMAWIGIVCFRIENIRLLGMPGLPGLGSFNEVNVRTYAHRDGMEPSVYFYSLDGGPWLTRRAARATYRVPYFEAQVLQRRDGNLLCFESRRPSGPGCRLTCELAEDLAPSEPGMLQSFLVDRFQLFASLGNGLWSARVSHAPYRIGRVEEVGFETDLPEACGLPTLPIEHVCWCPRVEASFYLPRRLL